VSCRRPDTINAPHVTTHSFNANQRLVDLEIRSQSAGTVRVRIPDNRNLVPPGHYMLFVVTPAKLRSEGHWVKIA